MQKRDFETYQTRSCQNFPRPTFLEVPFATPQSVAQGPNQIVIVLDFVNWLKNKSHLIFTVLKAGAQFYLNGYTSGFY